MFYVVAAPVVASDAEIAGRFRRNSVTAADDEENRGKTPNADLAGKVVAAQRRLKNITVSIEREGPDTSNAPATISNARATISSAPIRVDRMVIRARRKFNSLDADASGTLEGSELSELAEWAHSVVSPGGEPLTAEVKAAQGALLLKKLDANGDGVMDFDEFVGWFRKNCVVTQRHKGGLRTGSASKPYSPLNAR